MKVLIAYDGSEQGDAALRDLLRAGLGEDVDARVLNVAEVWVPPLEAVEGTTVWHEVMRDVRERAISELNRATAVAGIAADGLRDDFPKWEIKPEARAGPVAWSIIREAEQWPADLVVVGARGHAPLARLGIGGVALQVLTHLHCAVRVARD